MCHFIKTYFVFSKVIHVKFDFSINQSKLTVVTVYFLNLLVETLKQMKRELPYDINSLSWDKGHKSNNEEVTV